VTSILRLLDHAGKSWAQLTKDVHGGAVMLVLVVLAVARGRVLPPW